MPLTPATIPELLERHGLSPSRALGQNFLADPNTARRIVRLAGVEAGDRVLEIGPGIGSLTVALLEAGARVTAIELDRHVVPALLDTVGADAITLVAGDAMTIVFDDVLGDPGDAWRAVSNLPYNVATPIVMRLLEDAPAVRSMLVMVQREVGERLAAGPGTKAYGAVSVKVAYFAAARVVGIVPPSVFIPAPRVESALVELLRHPAPPVDVPAPARLFALVRAGFGQRRKMLRTSLKSLGADTLALLAASDIDPTARGETLSVHQFCVLARNWREHRAAAKGP